MMENISKYFELEFDGATGKAVIHKDEVEKIQNELDRLWAQNRELVEALKIVMPYMEELESENFEDESAGIRQDRQQTEVMVIARATLAKYK